MSAVLEARTYPAAMDQKLRRIRRRQFSLAVTRAFLLGCGAMTAAMLLAMTIDWYFTLFSTAMRTALTASALASGMATLLVTLIGPVRALTGLKRSAGDVDRATPQLEERWTTVANLLESNGRPRSAIGKAMLQQVTSEAVTMERLVEPARVARLHKLRRAVILCAVPITLVMMFLTVNWQHHRVLLQRFWFPLTDITATQLECVSGDLVVPRGDPVELVVRMAGLPRDTATIVLAFDGAEDEIVEVTSTDGSPTQFEYFVAALETSFRYRVQAGDGRTTWHTVTAIDRPALANVRMTLAAPEYVDRPVYEKDYLPAHVQAIQGSHLRLEMRPEAELKTFRLLLSRGGSKVSGPEDGATEAQEILLTADDDGWYRFEAKLEDDVSITPELLSPHGLTNEDVRKCSIRVIPDRAPFARVISPTEEMAVSPEEVVEVKFEAHDDHGITKAELVVYEESSVEGEPPTILGVEDIPLGNKENSPHVLATAELDLSKYALREGASISYAVRVTDNRNAMPGQRLDEAPEPSGKLHASNLESGAGNTDQAADVAADSGSRPNGESAPAETNTSPNSEALALDSKPVESNASTSDSPAESGSAAEMPDNASTLHKGESDADDLAKSNGDPASLTASDDANASAKTDITPTENDKATSPLGVGQSSDGKDNSAPAPNAQPKSDTEPAASNPAGTNRTATLDMPPNSTNSSAAEEQSPAVPRDAKEDADVAPPSDKRAAQSSNGSSEVASAASARNAVNGKTENDAKPQDSLTSAEVEAQLANTGEKEPRSSTASPAPGENSHTDQETSDGNPSLASGDLASANRRPPMPDDLRNQFTESNRLRLKIEAKTISAGEPGVDRETIQMKVRQRLEQIDRELKPAEDVLSSLVVSVSQSGIADPQIQELSDVDQRLAKVDQIIADLRNESKETPYAFVGLHMVEVGAAQITPARDRVFALIRQPDVDAHSNSAEALHRVNRARELLAELLVRFERVLRDERLANAIEETAKFYEVYVANLHKFLRAQSKPNPNPLQRKLAIVEVDQEYLDRLREVTEMRRDLMSEFARMLADDPRLLSKYMDLIKRRQTSLRDRLTELHERQGVISTELSGWLQVDEAQRADVWMLAAEVRLQDIAPLAQEASQLEERMNSQFPLALDPQARDSVAVLGDAKQLAIQARTGAAQARQLLRDPLAGSIDLVSHIESMAFWLEELDAALEQLAFNNGGEEATVYTDKRLAESRTLFENVVGWTELAAHLQEHRFHGLAKVDQHQLAFRTELLRIDMESIDQQLAAQFREGVPETVTVLANELKQLMEEITFNQAAATFELESERLNEATAQQALALAGFERAEELFDQIRRTVIEELDQVDPRDPSIADLVDPTLDELLERLEREPDLNALLGLPNRPQNLRVMSDFFTSNDGETPVPSALDEAAEQARQRAKKEEMDARRMHRETSEEDDLTEEHWRQIANAEEAQQKLQEKIDELKRRAADPETDPEEAAELAQMAEQLTQMQQQLAGRQIDQQQWEEMIRSDQMQAVLQAAARGEPLPDSQWNRLMSSLDEGLWQVRRRTPPEEYRQAIEQYQERIRKLISQESADVGQ